MLTASSLAWKTSPKSQDAVALRSRLRSVALYLWLIAGYPPGNRPLQQYLGLPPGAGYGQFEHKADSLIAKFKEARTAGEIYAWAESPRLSPLWLSASSSACHGLLIITVITPLPTKPSATKMPENQLANAAITDMQMRQRDVAALDAKYTKELADKAEMMLCVMMLPLVVVGCTSKQSVSQCVKPPPPPAWIMQPSPTGRHRWTGLFHPQREADHYAKQSEGTRSILMSSVDRVAHIDGQLMHYCEQYTRASMEHKCLK